jgi:hypothetical protein
MEDMENVADAEADMEEDEVEGESEEDAEGEEEAEGPGDDQANKIQSQQSGKATARPPPKFACSLRLSRSLFRQLREWHSRLVAKATRHIRRSSRPALRASGGLDGFSLRHRAHHRCAT